MRHYTIAIDGPSGAGKSTSADVLAKRLGISHLDTGAMYRALACALIADGLNPAKEDEVIPALSAYSLSVEFTPEGQHTLVNDQDWTERLYDHEISQAASDVSRYPAVRRYLVAEQRRIAEGQSFILDGRDIGTVVLPDADWKFFLTASPEVRAKRRLKDLEAKGEEITFAEVLKDIQRRDDQDQSRADSPLRRASDAYLIDSSELSFEQVIEYMAQKIEEKLGFQDV
ncbi:MAG: (d)CMP kinase [Eubacteriales bacterium]|nr:(d)CMP kinase [Eubacteriales bacterium]